MRPTIVQRLFGVCLSLLVIAACSAPATSTAPSSEPVAPTAATPAGPVTITFGVHEYNRAVYAPLAERFNAENPDVQVQLVSLDDLTRMLSPDGSRIQPIAATADTFIVTELPQTDAVRRGLLLDLAPFISADATLDRDDFYPGAIRSATDGTIALLPTELHLPLLAYNRDLWATRGLPPPAPDWTWADLRAAASQLAERNGDTITTYGLMQSTRLAVVRNPELTGEPDRIADLHAGRLQLDSPEISTMLEGVSALFRSGAVFAPPMYPDGSFLYTDDYMPLIQNQQLGMWMASFTQMPGSRPLPFAVGLAPLPATADPVLDVTRIGLGISAGTRSPDQAWRWIAFLSAQPTLNNFYGPTAVPARRSLTEASSYWDDLDAEGRAAVTALLERMPAAPPLDPAAPVRALSGVDPLSQALNTALNAILDENMPAGQALRAAQADLDAQVASGAAASPTPNLEPLAVATPRPAPTALPEATPITFISSPWSEAATRRLAERFNEQFPQYAVTLEPFPFPPDGVLRFTDLAAAADCFGGWNSPATAADRAAVLDLQPLLDADAAFPRDDYPAALLDLFRAEGGLYGLPDGMTTRTIFYNRDLFDAAGSAYPDATWRIADFTAAAQALTSGMGANRQYGFAALQDDDLLFYLSRVGVAPYRWGGTTHTPNFTDPAVAAAITDYVNLLAATAPEMDQDGANAAMQLVNQGRVAMWIGSGISTDLLADNLPFALGIAAVPLAEQPLTQLDLAPEGLFISADTPAVDACWAWLRFLSADAERFSHTLPTRRSLATAPEFVDRAPAGVATMAAAYSAALERGFAPTMPLPRGSVTYYWLQRAAARAMEGANLADELADAQFFTEQFQACVQSGEGHGACLRQVDPGYDGWYPESG